MTLKVNETNLDSAKDIEELIDFYVSSVVGTRIDSKTNLWNIQFCQNSFQNSLKFMQSETTGIQHSGIVIIHSFLRAFETKACKRILKSEFYDLVVLVVVEFNRRIQRLKELNGQEKKKRRLENKQAEEILRLNKEKAAIVEEMESKKTISIDIVEVIFKLLRTTKEETKQFNFEKVLDDLQCFFSYPCVEVHCALFRNLEVLRREKKELFFKEETLKKVLVYCFNLLKKRNFDVDLGQFSVFFHWIISLCSSVSSDLFDSCFKIFAKVLSNSAVF